jgi:hypothetical protein
MTNEADILIVTVTKVESSATIQAFEPISGVKATPLSIEDRIYFDLGNVNNARVFLTQSEMGSGGLGASLLTVRKGIEPEAIGGEMEGAGLYVACQDKKVDWILVKGICDWADGEKGQDKESRQKTAASNAAAFVVHTLEFVSIDWRQRRGKEFLQPEESGGIKDSEILKPVLEMAQRSLGILEERAAGFGKLHMPVHLQIELDAKRQEVLALEAQLMDVE